MAALPGRKFILTNGDVGHAEAVLNKVGLAGQFTDIFDIRAMKYTPKPLASAYESFLEAHGVDARRTAFFDDLEKNHRVPHEIGMRTVLVTAAEDYTHAQVESWELGHGEGEHIHYTTDDLAAFLSAVR
jgi:putative hydrolase of the HAD superfamily